MNPRVLRGSRFSSVSDLAPQQMPASNRDSALYGGRRVPLTLARLLAAALLVCSVLASAQDHPKGGPIIPSFYPMILPYYIHHPCIVPSVPWRVFPDLPWDLGSGFRFEVNGYPSAYVSCPPSSGRYENASTGGSYTEHIGDSTCYAIRSYVVARDSKNSDSTHAVSYSTCQPSARYQLKTTEMR